MPTASSTLSPDRFAQPEPNGRPDRFAIPDLDRLAIPDADAN